LFRWKQPSQVHPLLRATGNASLIPNELSTHLCDSGGPLETVKDSNTGYLCPPEPERFASAMMSLLDEPQLVAEMGRNGRRHVLDNFSVQLFGDNLERLLKE
jgi:glycosyltransferase involved in cell wall biosynthesis